MVSGVKSEKGVAKRGYSSSRHPGPGLNTRSDACGHLRSLQVKRLPGQQESVLQRRWSFL